MELQDWVQIGLMAALVVVTLIYALRTHAISQSSDGAAKATAQQAEATVALASREYAKEFIRLEIYPLLKRCSEIKKILDKNYFGSSFLSFSYKTGWPEVSGSPSELTDEEVQVLKLGDYEQKEVFSFPEPSLGILQHRWLTDVSVYHRLDTLENEQKKIAENIAAFDSKQSHLDKLLRSLAVEVKRLVAPYIQTKTPSEIDTDLNRGRFVSYIAEICFNHLLMDDEDFGQFFSDFEREQAKYFWKENKDDVQALVGNYQVSQKVGQLKKLSSELSREVSQIHDRLGTIENEYRRKCYITFQELPPYYL